MLYTEEEKSLLRKKHDEWKVKYEKSKQRQRERYKKDTVFDWMIGARVWKENLKEGNVKEKVKSIDEIEKRSTEDERIQRQHLVTRVVDFILVMYYNQLFETHTEKQKYDKALHSVVSFIMLIGEGIRPTEEEFVETMKVKRLYPEENRSERETAVYKNIKRYIKNTIGFSNGEDANPYLLKEIKAEVGERFYFPVKSV